MADSSELVKEEAPHRTELKCYDIKRSSQFLRDLNQYRKEELFIDFIITVQGRRFPAHRVVMASLSDYFKATLMFEGKDVNELTLNDSVEPDVFSLIVDYAYSGFLTITKDNVQSILEAANYFNIPYLLNECQSFMIARLNLENVCQAVQFAFHYSLKTLRDAAVKYFTKNLEDLMRKKEYADLEPETLIAVFDDDDLVTGTKPSPDREETILRAVLHYQTSKHIDDPGVFDKLLKTVRLPQIPAGRVREIAKDFDDIAVSRVFKKFLTLDAKIHKQNNHLQDGTDGIPRTWKKPRKFAAYDIIHRGIRYGVPPLSDRPWPDGFDICDPELEIESINIWLRPASIDIPSVIGGIAVRYRKTTGSVDDPVYIKGQFLPHWECHPVLLNAGEHITEVTVHDSRRHGGSTDRAVYNIEFLTTKGRRFGPFGEDTTGIPVTEYHPSDSRYRESYLYSIHCDSEIRTGGSAITNLALRWIKL